MTERLTETYPCNKCKVEFCSRLCYSMTRWAEIAKDKLAEYETAEKEGRLVVLPCKVGDAVYVVKNRHIEVFEVNKIKLKPNVFRNVTYYLKKPSRRGCLYKYYSSEFGNKWFLVREEAEKALKEMEEK